MFHLLYKSPSNSLSFNLAILLLRQRQTLISFSLLPHYLQYELQGSLIPFTPHTFVYKVIVKDRIIFSSLIFHLIFTHFIVSLNILYFFSLTLTTTYGGVTFSTFFAQFFRFTFALYVLPRLLAHILSGLFLSLFFFHLTVFLDYCVKLSFIAQYSPLQTTHVVKSSILFCG